MLQSLLDCSLYRYTVASFKPASPSPDGSIAAALHYTVTIQVHFSFPGGFCTLTQVHLDEWENVAESLMQQFILGGQARQPIHTGLTAANPINTSGVKLCVTAQQNELAGQPPAWQSSPLPEGRHPHLPFFPPLFLTSGLVPCSAAELEWAEIC